MISERSRNTNRQRYNQHPVLFGHRPAKLVRRARDFSRRTNVSSEDCENRCDITKRTVSTPGVAPADENRRIRDAIGNLVVKLAHF